MTTDAKIQEIALAYIRKNTSSLPGWACTASTLHPSLIGRLSLDDGELVLVSAFFSAESWYAFTTRRIIGQFQGVLRSLDPSHGIHAHFGDFKGYGPDRDEDMLQDENILPSENRIPGVVPREVATITATDSGAVVRFEFETWRASMLPIYAARYWHVKHPAIDKLMTEAERENYRAKIG